MEVFLLMGTCYPEEPNHVFIHTKLSGEYIDFETFISFPVYSALPLIA